MCQHIDRLRPVLKLLSGLGCRLAVSKAGLTVVSTSYIKSLQVEIVKLHPGWCGVSISGTKISCSCRA